MALMVQGVGFSFTNDPSGYENITDAESSHDNYMFLLAWFNVFSDFKSNDFYITAGVCFYCDGSCFDISTHTHTHIHVYPISPMVRDCCTVSFVSSTVRLESYGGHYGPTLAEQLIDNENSINMKGLLIGNPGINSDW